MTVIILEPHGPDALLNAMRAFRQSRMRGRELAELRRQRGPKTWRRVAWAGLDLPKPSRRFPINDR